MTKRENGAIYKMKPAMRDGFRFVAAGYADDLGAGVFRPFGLVLRCPR